MVTYIDIKELVKKHDGDEVTIIGWVKTNRDSGKISFIELNDGSTVNNIQVVCKREITTGYDDSIKTARTGSAISVNGKISTNKNNNSQEIIAKEIQLLKQSDEDYPLQKKAHSLDYLREIAHLRPRTTMFGAIMRIRSKLSFAIHKFFDENGFLWVATPIITGNDAEGAGDNFVLSEDSKNPIFDRPASLTVSGQLHGEAYAQAFRKIYTFGPTFRAEHSHTFRHANEFWMIEPEIAFCNLSQLQILIELFIKYITQYVVDECSAELEYFYTEKPFLKDRIDAILSSNYKRLDYIEAIEILQKAVENGKVFADGVTEFKFGTDIGTPEERFLCEEVFKCPVFLQNLPLEMKAFYMKQNGENKKYNGTNKLEGFSGVTVAANDLLIPGVGEVIGGSQREDDINLIEEESKKRGIDTSSISWYVNLRKYGYHSSSGFGIGFERMLMVLLDLNIRDAIPFPRVPGKLLF